jgi:hypothetical protein
MVMRKKDYQAEMVIDLTGPEGNAFVLMGYAREFSRQLCIDSEEVIEKMQSGDYDNLVKVFDEYFGDFVILEY